MNQTANTAPLAAPAKPKRRMSFTYWWDAFKPTGTPVEGKSAGGPNINGEYKMYETYGQDLQTVMTAMEKTPENVWTLLEGEGSNMEIVPGLRRVNRMGYYITEKPYTDPERGVVV